jgi:adenosine deaminase
MNGVAPQLVQFLHRIPKAELHCHLDGSLRPETLLDLARERNVTLPVSTPRELADWMRVDDARNLEDYLARFDVTLSVMQDVTAIERIARELVIDAAADGVRYIEIRFCPSLSTRGGLNVDDVMHAIIRGADNGERETGTIARHIVCALRTFPESHAMEMAELAVAHRGPVVAYDLAGGEAGHPASRFAASFDHARNHDLAVTVHAGEGAGAESIREAVHRCGANRIGHGTRLFEDTSLFEYVVDRQIPLEVCPTSNVQTRVARTFGAHPLAQYLAAGAFVTLNTDNRMMSGVSLTDEYVRCAEHLGFDHHTLAALAVQSFDGAFLAFRERQAMRDAAAAECARLLSAFEVEANAS